jgi:hypothetical protein
VLVVGWWVVGVWVVYYGDFTGSLYRETVGSHHHHHLEFIVEVVFC